MHLVPPIQNPLPYRIQRSAAPISASVLSAAATISASSRITSASAPSRTLAITPALPAAGSRDSGADQYWPLARLAICTALWSLGHESDGGGRHVLQPDCQPDQHRQGADQARRHNGAQPQQSCHEGPFGQIEDWMLESMATCKNRELCTKTN
jgi:hypothetical protein